MPKILLNEVDRVLLFPGLSRKILPRAYITVPTEMASDPQIVAFSEKKYLTVYSVTEFERRQRSDALKLAKDKAEEAARAAADANAIAEARKNEANAALESYEAIKAPAEKPADPVAAEPDSEPRSSRRGKKHHG